MINLHEIVTRLVGPIEPIGDTRIDDERFENLKVMCDLTDKLLADIDAVIPGMERMEHSIKRAGIYANDFMMRLGIDVKEDT